MIASLTRATRRFACALLAAAAMAVPGAAVQAAKPPLPPTQTGAVVSPAVHMDTSPPLRSLPPGTPPQPDKHEAHKARPFPGPGGDKSAASGTPSPTTTTAIPATSLSFDGVGNGFNGPQGTFTVNAAPPDTNLSVGPSNVVEIVNTDFAIFNKSGSVLYGPVTINTLWSGFGGGCQTNNDGDPVVKYDSIADRWVISQFSVSTTPYLQCVAVSQTSDPTGVYFRYSFQYSNFPDYPKLGIWSDAYYITFNQFSGNTFVGGLVCAYDRTKMLAGQAPTQQCFSNSYGGLLPADLDGSQLPPSGSPTYIVADGASANQLAYWRFHVDWTNSANSTLTGPSNLATAAFTAPCGGRAGACVPQSGTNQQLDTLGDRIMYRLAYRNFGDHEALVVNRTVSAGSSIGVRWYELRTGAGNSLSIFQQGTYAPDATYRWMGSIAQDVSGDMALGFSTSSSTTHPGIHYTGRLPADPAGTMSQGEASIIDSAGSQTANLSRWGDYSSMAVDPDGCTFWYANEYIPSNGTFNWKTRIASFKFPSCGTQPPTNDFSISASPSSQTFNQGAGTSYTVSTATTAGSAQTVNLSASGLPAGAGATFNPTSVTSGGSSTISVTTSTSTPGGTYTITITGTGTSATHSTTVSLVVNAPAGIANGGFETGAYTGWSSTGTASITTTSHSGTYAAMVGGTSPTNGDSTISQTFTAPSPTGPLTFWYQIVCPDTITYDWASATLVDNTANTTTTVLPQTCTNTGTWVQSSTTSLVGGHSYTLTLLSHDDNYPADPTYTLFDDVTLAPPPSPDFAISATPSSQTVVQGNSTSYSVSVSAQNGFNGTVNLSASGFGAGASGTLSPTTVTGSGSSTLTVTTTASAATGSFPITITGASGSISHNASVTVVVSPPPDFSLSASPSSETVSQGNGTTYTVAVTALNGFNSPVSLGASGFGAGASGSFSPASITGGGSATLNVSTTSAATTGTYTITITGTSGSLSHSASVTLVVNMPAPSAVTNGGFETGDLTGWTASGATSISTRSHTGSYSAQVGSANPYPGDSSIAQTFTAPSGTGHTLSFLYLVVCTDSVRYDWATVTLRDNTTGTTTTVLSRTCLNDATWHQVSVSVTGGHSYTLTLIDHDDNWASPPDPTYTLYDDVAVS